MSGSPRDIRDIIEVLGKLIAEEEMSVRRYQLMAERCRHALDNEMLLSLCADERRHVLVLQDIFRELTGREYPVGEVFLALPDDHCESLRQAILTELDTVTVYQELSRRLRCLRHKEVMFSIINDEKNHARRLAGIYKANCRI